MPMNTNFEQLRKQELELRKLLEELDTLPQTPQIKLQKQKIQTYIDKITPSILSGFSQKFKEITKNLPNEFEKEKPTPTKEPQTTPTPCKDLVVSTPKDKTYITYHNNANKVNLGKLSEREANLLFAIFQRLKDQGNTLIRFEPQDLKRMLGIKISYDNLTRTARSMWNKIKTADFWEVRDIIVDGRECVSEKNYMLFQVCEIVSDKETREFLYMDIQLNTGYNYLLNNLGMGGQYTSFNLLEFQRVRGKYAKTLYRLLKQYKSTGILSVEWGQFRELLDIPKDYTMPNIDKFVLKIALKELHKIYPFEHLSYKKERKSHDKRKVTHIDFYFEQLPEGETKKQKQADKQRAQRDIKLIAWDIKRQGIIKRSKETLEVREMDLKSLIGSLFENPNGVILKIENITKEKNQFFMHVSYPNRKSEPQKIPVSDKRYALEFLYVTKGFTFKKDNLLQEIETFTPNIHPITKEPIKEFAEYIGKTINITNNNVDQFPDGITSYLKITNIVKLNDHQIQISIQDVDKPDKLLKPFIAKDEKHLKNWFKKYYR
ncbi:RepB family plasmid replication initiator protein [Helicobacter pylori]|uniref:replication initiation protein n=1 Tax=Helicobacter pylori TaxID=210 RepID=UPI000FDD1C8F|nr:replication initiation protein [Helicobacter pylori]RVY62349.1 RepB family plasmid replication initiator protein [Helicobacter pylori]